MLTYLMDQIPSTSLGGDFGVVGTVFIAIGSLGPTFVGVVAERAGYEAAFLALAGPLLAYTALAGWLSTRSGR
jgi:hypothetical protein